MTQSEFMHRGVLFAFFGLSLVGCWGVVGDASSSVPVDEAAKDASVLTSDAAVSLDAGTMQLDAGTMQLDAGTMQLDAGTTQLDAGTTQFDAGTTQLDAGATQLDAGVPIFIAVGAGAWRATTCDRGRHWYIREESSNHDDHTEWAAFAGLAAGNGTFVFATGWGEPGHFFASHNGTSWVEPVTPNSSVNSMMFDGSQFVAIAGGLWESPDGETWSKRSIVFPPASQQIRKARAFRDAGMVVVAENQNSTERPRGSFVIISEDGARTWREGTGFDSACAGAIQHHGDVELIGQRLMVSEGESVCLSNDFGHTWLPATKPFEQYSFVTDLFTDGTSFYAVAGRKIRRMVDVDDGGVTWESLVDLGVALEKASWADGTFVAVSSGGTRFFFSDNAVDWHEGSAPSTLGQTWVRDLGFGWGSPSASDVCPR